MKKDIGKKIARFLGICMICWGLYRLTPIHEYISLAYIQKQSICMKAFAHDYYVTSVMLYVLLFSGTIALSIPSSIILTLLGGYLFGALAGALYATVAVTIGVTIAYMIFRIFLQDMLRQTYKDRAYQFERAMKEYGASYLLMLNFSAIFPYFVMNGLAAIARVPITTIMWTTIVGFIPQALVYAYAGKGLATIRNVHDILSSEIIFAFMLLIIVACIPIIIKKYKKHISL